MKNILFLLAVCIVTFSCNTSNKTTSDATPPEKISLLTDDSISELDDNPVFFLYRESCRGYCPGYTYTIFESGKVDYFGQRNVDRVGNHIATLKASTLIDLKNLADKLDCKKMDDEYNNKKIMDIPRWTFKYEEKSILFTENLAPDNLNKFCKKMDVALDSLTWEKID